MEVYQAMKERVFAQEEPSDYLVLNYDDERTRGMIDRAPCRVYYFSRRCELDEGAFVSDGELVIKIGGRLEKLCSIEELGIKGAHNVENALAASMVAALAGATAEGMRPVLMKFTGVEHRIEFVRELDGVKYSTRRRRTRIRRSKHSRRLTAG